MHCVSCWEAVLPRPYTLDLYYLSFLETRLYKRIDAEACNHCVAPYTYVHGTEH